MPSETWLTRKIAVEALDDAMIHALTGSEH